MKLFFWIELLEESKLASADQIRPIKREAVEILSVTARARKTAQVQGRHKR